jgi:hypothetical protein
MTLRFVAVLAMLAAPLSAQRTWVVDLAGGPGTHFTDIPPAVAAASAGDRIEVRGAGPYSGFTLRRGIDVEAVSRALVMFISVQGVPAGERAWVSGFDVGSSSSGVANLVEAVSCGGAVVFRGLRFRGGFPFGVPPTNAGALVSQSGAVLFSDCQFVPNWFASNVVATLRVMTVSRVMLQRCVVVGADALITSSDGGNAVVSDLGNDIIVDQSGVIGGIGGDAPYARPACAGNGGHGLYAGSGLLLRGSLVSGGRGGFGNTYCPGMGATGSAVLGSGYRATSSCRIQAPSAPVARIPELPVLTAPVEMTQGVPGAVVAAGGPANGLLLILLDPDHGHSPVAGLEQRLLLTPRLLIGPVLALDQAGGCIWPLTLPPDPAWRNRFLFLQALALGGATPQLTDLADVRMR